MGWDHASATGGRSVLNRAVHGQPQSSTSVSFSRLGCLSSLAWFIPLSFPCITSLSAQLCSARPVYRRCNVFPRVPIRNFTARVKARQLVPVATPRGDSLPRTVIKGRMEER